MIENSNPEDLLPKAVLVDKDNNLSAGKSNRKSIILIYPNNEEEFIIDPKNELIDFENLSGMRRSYS